MQINAYMWCVDHSRQFHNKHRMRLQIVLLIAMFVVLVIAAFTVNAIWHVNRYGLLPSHF